MSDPISASQIESAGNRLESRRTLKLSNSDTIKFLQLYRDEKLLYDIRIPQYSNRNLRKKAIKRIADAMNIPGFGTRQVKEKFKNLRNAYSQEIKKIEVRKTNVPSCAENCYVSKVHWFSTMHSFLRSFIYHRFALTGKSPKKKNKLTAQVSTTTGSQPLNEETFKYRYYEKDESISYSSDLGANDEEAVIVLDKSSDSYDTNFDDDNYRDDGISDKGSRTGGSLSTASQQRLPQHAHMTLDRTSHVTMSTVDSDTEDFEIFGKSVASHLRQFPLQTALEAQRLIIDYLIKTHLEHVYNVTATPAEIVQPLPSVAIPVGRSLRSASLQTLELSCDSSDSDPDL